MGSKERRGLSCHTDLRTGVSIFKRRGRIINISSRAALGKEGRSIYGATKAAVTSLTRTWALELGRDGITVNAIAPGPIETELFRSTNPIDSSATKALLTTIPVGRVGTPEDVAAAVAFSVTNDGWLRTGDLGYRGKDGYLFIVGRLKELIIRSGFNVYPAEVETALNSYPDVVQSAVIGRKASGNEEVVAFVEAKAGSGLQPSALRDHTRERLAAYKRPQHIFILEKIPAAQPARF